MARVLVVYFSATGTTKTVAGRLAEVINADVFEIIPAEPYTKEDLDWREDDSRSSVEMKDPASRPAISGTVDNMDQYDTIFVGAPIWWYVMPRIINTFLEAHDLSGKKIILFATSGGSGLGRSVEKLEESAPHSHIIAGEVLNNDMSDDDLKAFAEKYNKDE